MQKTLYVLIRNDLQTLAYKVVQAGHAVAQYMLEYAHWQNHRLIYVTVSNEGSLLEWQRKLQDKGIDHSVFFEPDLDDQPTALACSPDNPQLFRKLNLLKG